MVFKHAGPFGGDCERMDNKQNTNGGSRSVTIRMKMPVFVAALVILVAGLIWIFILGVMVGRGVNTREQLGPLAIFVPGPPTAEATGEIAPSGLPAGQSLVDSDTGEPGQPEQADNPTGGLEDLFKDETLLRSEELDFRDNLRSQTDSGRGGSVSGGQEASVAASTGVSPAQTARPEQIVPSTAQQNTRVAVGQQSGSQTSGDTVYEFIYQVSSYSQLHQAQNLTQRLNGGGIPAQIELHKTSSATWYRVLVSFTGREAELGTFQQKLKQFNLSSPLLRKKKALAG